MIALLGAMTLVTLAGEGAATAGPAVKKSKSAPSPAVESGLASIYCFRNGRTASGERARPFILTAAHKTLPFGTLVEVTNQRNGRSIVVRINDRGPFIKGRIIDLTPAGARALKFDGLTPVTLRVLKIDPDKRRIGLSLKRVSSAEYADKDYWEQVAASVNLDEVALSTDDTEK